jgi:diadenosine tetraphosphatase ApaH/serine/threonine PP2A family protein phosphatase
VIVGSLNGSILDLFRVLKHYGSPVRQNYIFLGGLGNGGEFGTQVVTLVLLMKVLWPAAVYIIRGCDEFSEVCNGSGLRAEFDLLYGAGSAVYSDVIRAFSFLPFAAVVNTRVFCCYGGIGRNLVEPGAVAAIQRPVDAFDKGVICELCWSEPTTLLPMFLPASRGYGNLFGGEGAAHFLRRNHLDLIVRTHSSISEGCLYTLDDQVMTVFSSGHPEGRVGVFLLSPLIRQPVTWPGYPPIKRGDVTFVTSLTENSFVVQQSVSVIPTTRRASQGALPVCGGLRLTATKMGIAVPLTSCEKRKPTIPIVKKPVFPALRKLIIELPRDR